MRVSQSGIDLIKRFEGLRLEAYPDPASGGDPWTIGYGTTRTAAGPVTPGMTITQAQAEELLRDDLRFFESRVNDLVKVPLNQQQFDALVSLAYNIGAVALERSTLLRELNAGNYQEAGEQFLRWNQAAGKVMPGLVARRTQERNLFMQPAGATPPVPSSSPTPVPEPAPAAPAAQQYIDPMQSSDERSASEAWERRQAYERDKATRARSEPDGLTADAPTPSPGSAPALPPGGSMPLPVAAVVGLGAELLKLLPFAQRPQKADQIEAVSAQLIKLAQAAAGPGAVNEQAAVDTVRANPQARAAFVASAATQWADIAPMLEFDSRERKEARSFVSQMTGEGPEWRQVGTGLLIGVLSLMIVGGGGTMFWRLLMLDGLDPGQKGLILGALLAAFATVIGFWFGSSASSSKKDQTIQEQARR